MANSRELRSSGGTLFRLPTNFAMEELAMKIRQRRCLGLLALFAAVMVARIPATAQQAPSAAGS